MEEYGATDETADDAELDWCAADYFDPDAGGWQSPVEPVVPDDVGLVVETANMVSVLAAERYERIDALRERALADGKRYGGAIAEVVERSVRLDLAAALRVGETTAGSMLAMAEALVHRYPTVLASLGQARITEAHAEALVSGVDVLEPALAERIVPRALAIAEVSSVTAFRRSLRRLIDTERAQTLAERHAEAVKRRRVVVENVEDGMAWLHAYIPAVEARAIHGRLTAMGKAIIKETAVPVEHAEPAGGADHAEPVAGADYVEAAGGADRAEPVAGADHVEAAGGADHAEAALAAGHTGRAEVGDGAGAGQGDLSDETRSLDQVRADILGDLLIDGDTSEVPATARGIRATVVVTVPVLSLLEDTAPRGGDPAVVEGVGPIPHQKARELSGGSRDWMRVLTHPETGMVLSVGRDRYEPPKALRDLVTWRAEHCMAPGCGMPASRCEVDHTLAWVDGGQTSLQNLAPLCKGHHTIKHHGGWRIRQVPGSGGAIEWTSPSGRQYVVQPERRVPVFRPADASDAPF